MEGNIIEKPQDIVKRPMVLEFLGLEEKTKYTDECCRDLSYKEIVS
jgi:predicted nuclease of restriction endonuclease-like (RecB) superfamily